MQQTSRSPGKLPTLRRAAGLVFVAGVLSRLIGLFREMLIAQHFGVSESLDAVYLGLAVPMALTVGIGSALGRAAVPVAAGISSSRLRGLTYGGARRLLFVLTPFALIMAATAPLWMHLLTIGDGDTPRTQLAISTMAGSLVLITVGITGLWGGIANARGNHTTISITPLIYNIIICAAILALHESIGALSVLVGIMAAEYSQVAIHWPAVAWLTRGSKPVEDREDWKGIKLKFWPAAVAGILMGLNVAIDRVFATILDSGAIAALSYADKLVNLPVGLFGMALAVPLFTRMSRFRAQGRARAFHLTALLGIRLLVIVGLPSAAFLVWAAKPAVAFLLQRGAFGEEAITMTTIALQGYAIGIPFLAISLLLLSAGMTIRRPWLVAWVMLAGTVLNALLDWILVRRFGLMGIALSTSIVAAARVLVLLVVISSKMLGARALWLPIMRMVVYSGVLAGALYATSAVLGLDEWTSRAGTLWTLVIGAGVWALVTGVMWKPLLRREWRSLERLRREAAGANV